MHICVDGQAPRVPSGAAMDYAFNTALPRLFLVRLGFVESRELSSGLFQIIFLGFFATGVVSTCCVLDPDQVCCLPPSNRLQLIILNRSNQTLLPWQC
jgi:hypothetical protein